MGICFTRSDCSGFHRIGYFDIFLKSDATLQIRIFSFKIGILIGFYGIDRPLPPLHTPIDIKLLVDEVSADKISINLK